MKKNKLVPILQLVVILGVVSSFALLWYLVTEHNNVNIETQPEPSPSSNPVVQVTPTPRHETLIIYPTYPPEILTSQDYNVEIQQSSYTHEIPVYDRTTAVETWWGRSEQPDRYRRFCEFAFTGEPINVKIQPNFPIQSYRVLSSSGIPTGSYDGKSITISLTEPETVMLELNDDYNTILTIFAEAPEANIPHKEDDDVLFIEGYYEPEGGYLPIDEPGTCVYLAPGAVLCARIGINADNVTVCGRGVVLDPWSNLLDYDITQAPDNKLVNIKGNQVTLDGIKLLDSRNYNLWVDFGVEKLTVSSVKVLSTAATTDGLTLLGTTNSTVQDCFFYCGDNALVFEEQLAGTQILNCMVGTSCGAIFPQQDISGEILLDGLYVFRADEGLVNNRYNNKDRDRIVDSVTIRNLNASDCRNLPWFFHGRFMGVQSKNFTFENIALPQITSVMDGKLEQPGSIIRMDNYPQDRLTGGYRMNFTNLYVDGTAVESSSTLLRKDKGAPNNRYTVSVTQPSCPMLPSPTVTVEQQDTASRHEQNDSTVDNLLAERRSPYASIWCDGVPYLTDLTLSAVDGTTVYRLAVSPNDYENGSMVTPLEITQDDIRSSNGVSLSFEASTDTPCNVTLRLTTATSDGFLYNSKPLSFTPGWNSYSLTWGAQELEQLLESDDGLPRGIVLEITPQGGGKDILFKGFNMTLTP